MSSLLNPDRGHVVDAEGARPVDDVTTTLLDAALRYASLGLRIFPLVWHGHPDDDKIAGTPLVKWKRDATSNEKQIRGWWDRWPEAGIGLACGDELDADRYLFVLDLDRHNPDEDGIELFADLEADHGAVEDGPTVLTAGGGRHLYFKSPRELTNARGTLPRGIDVRGRGGYVVLPPSSHKSGGRHEWEHDHALGEVKIPEAPQWLLDILSAPEPSTSTTPEISPQTATGDVWQGLDPKGPKPSAEWARATAWETLLEADGWTHFGPADDGGQLWTRPGKDPKDGQSASLYYRGSDNLYIFTTNAPAGLPVEEPISKYGYYTFTRHGGDFDAAAKALAGTASTTVDVYRDDDLPTFPLDAFPLWIRQQVEQVAEEMQVSADLPAMLALGALATITGGRVRVAMDGPHTEPTNLYLAVALPSGAGKSPVFGFMIEKPLGTWEEELDEGHQHERSLAASLRKAAEKAHEKAILSGAVDEIRKTHAELAEHVEIPRPRLFVDDVTVEKLVILLAEQNGRLALVSTEAGVFQAMTGRYSDVTFLDPYLQAWAGETIRVDRVNRPEVIVRRPALTVAVTVQPIVISGLSKNPELRGRGLPQRFMYALPEDLVGTRDRGRRSTFDRTIDARYRTEIVDLGRTLADLDETELALSDGAVDLYVAWKNAAEPKLAAGGEHFRIREWIAKAQSSAARVAALLHIAERFPVSEPISVDTMRKAIAVADYWIEHAHAVHYLWGERTDVEEAVGAVLGWIERTGPTTFTARDVQRGVHAVRHDRELRYRVLGKLVEDGVCSVDRDPSEDRAGRPGATFTVEPVALSRGRGHPKSVCQTLISMEMTTSEAHQPPATARQVDDSPSTTPPRKSNLL